MPAPTVVASLAEFEQLVGTRLGPSDWMRIDQERIDTFARATDDQQWIHTDVERARRESPWKETIAHGYLTLSLAPALLTQILQVRNVGAVINTGVEKMRLAAPVPSGSNVRLSAEVANVRSMRGDRARVSFDLRFELEGSSRPACTARVVYVYVF
jgi:acyl dehydratase